MKQNLRGPSLISAFPQYGVPLDWGFCMTSENRCVGVEDPGLVICHMCVGYTLELKLMIHGGLPTHSLPDQIGVFPWQSGQRRPTRNIFRLF